MTITDRAALVLHVFENIVQRAVDTLEGLLSVVRRNSTTDDGQRRDAAKKTL